jgi:hypothetical protein
MSYWWRCGAMSSTNSGNRIEGMSVGGGIVKDVNVELCEGERERENKKG